METIPMPETSASGVFPNDMIQMGTGFTMSSLKLNSGDILFLYTDGIDEAKRLFRDKNYLPIVCAEPGLALEEEHGTHTVGQDGEEMTQERVDGIIEAVIAHGIYRLEKWHNPAGDEILEFDFSDCEGTAEEAIMALVSVEKVFRMYRPAAVSDADRVQVDVKIDDFLTKHFRQYDEYCLHHEKHQAPEYLYYTQLMEDKQYDDLTLMAIKKK